MMIIVRCCSNSDESSMDSPVRYTPKKSLKYNKVNDYTPAAKESKNFEVRRFTNPDSLYVEFSNAGERSSIGFSVHEKSLDNDFKEGTYLYF